MNKLHDKLNAGIEELELRLKQDTMRDIQRIYGYCLGLYISCKHLNPEFMHNKMEYYIRLDIGQRKLKELRLL